MATRILVVEDESAHAEAILRSLETLPGMEFRVMGTLREFQDQAVAWAPDIALVDLNLPDGRATEILADPAETRHFPVIVMTSFGTERVAVEALKAGALDYLVKSPETFKELPRTLERLLREWQFYRERKQAEDALREAEQFSDLVLSSAQEGIIVYGPDLHYRVWNAHMEQLTGMSAGTVIGRHPLDLFPFVRVSGLMDCLEEVLAGAARRALDMPFFLQSTGRTGWSHHVISPFRNLKGETIGVMAMVADITESKLAEVALRESEQRYRNQFNLASDGICSANLDYEAIEYNEAFARMHGYRPEEVRQLSLRQLERPECHPQIPERIRRILAGTALTFETEHLHKDGHAIPVEVTASLVAAGIKPTILCFYRDITERRAMRGVLEQRVQERTAQLEAANRELQAFSYSVSHDLRAPLRGIDGFSQILEEDYQDSLDEVGRNYLHRIRHGVLRMGLLIDDLLKLSQIHRQELNQQDLDLSCLAGKVVADLEQANPERRVACVIQPAMRVEGDARLIRVMLDNLLGNAWKFTARQPEPRIEVGEQVPAGAERVFFIRDNGAGFDMTYQDKLFKAFQRLHSATEFDGTGIGLAIVQRIIHRHGGRVWAESELGRGATFFFTLPGRGAVRAPAEIP
ncbi:MAG: PAS domain S-box protein [Holophaga sp.]|nr:PAS domain S-box protein [Holophaga sp.]